MVLAPAPRLPFRSLESNGNVLLHEHSPISVSTSESQAAEGCLSEHDEAKIIETVKILIAMLYTIKNHLRAEWGVAVSFGTQITQDGQETTTDEYKDLLPPGLKGYEHRGLGLTLEYGSH